MSKNMHTVSEDLTCKKVPEAIVNFEIFSGITMIICSSSSYEMGHEAGDALASFFKLNMALLQQDFL